MSISPRVEVDNIAIATVRVAPIERWCEYEKRKPASFPEVDYEVFQKLSVRIIPISMKVCTYEGCTGRTWLVEPKCLQEIYAITGGICEVDTRFCEHMLEMD